MIVRKLDQIRQREPDLGCSCASQRWIGKPLVVEIKGDLVLRYDAEEDDDRTAGGRRPPAIQLCGQPPVAFSPQAPGERTGHRRRMPGIEQLRHLGAVLIQLRFLERALGGSVAMDQWAVAVAVVRRSGVVVARHG